MRFILALAAAAVLAAPMAAPMAGPVAAAPQAAPVIVAFARDSDQLDAAGRSRLAQAVAQHRAEPTRAIVIAGHGGADDGSASYAVGLSQRRANTVRDYLVAQGVPPGQMTTLAFGQSRPAAGATGPAAHRRVEVALGDVIGW